MIACGAIDGRAGIALRLYGVVHCRAEALGENGFQLLAGGSMFGRLLSGMLILAVALVGYRMAVGNRPTTRDAVLWVARAGAVLALTGSWSAYGTLFHRVAVAAPGEIGAVILPAADLGDPATLAGRVQAVYDGLVAAAARENEGDGTSPPPPSTVTDPAVAPAVPVVVPPWSPRALALTGAAIAIVALGLGGLLAAQVATGLLLALGPLFVTTLLFDATRGLFAGWLRALVAAFLGALASMAVLSIELELLRPETLSPLSTPDPAAALAIILTFAIILLAAWWTCVRAAGRIRLPGDAVARFEWPAFERATLVASRSERGGGPTPVEPVANDGRSATRIRSMGDAMLRRERAVAAQAVAAGGSSGHRPGGGGGASGGGGPVGSGSSRGQGQRRTAWRATASATRRDGRG